ncbi:MAG: hypothetical protein ACRDJH_02945 [Thermomicrobiales bacterium]
MGFAYLQSLIEDPSRLLEAPNGATIAFIHDDDPETAEANLKGAIERFRKGKNVYLRHVTSSKP